MAADDEHGVTESGRYGHRGAVVWFTGLSGAGKSTLANALDRHLARCRVFSVVLDGDVVRQGLSSDLTYSPRDRSENLRRAIEVAALVASHGGVAIAAFVSPFAADRLLARTRMASIGKGVPFVEVFVDASLRECERRDVKGLYGEARSGRLVGLTGVDSPYEVPSVPEISLPTGLWSEEKCVRVVVSKVRAAIRLPDAGPLELLGGGQRE